MGGAGREGGLEALTADGSERWRHGGNCLPPALVQRGFVVTACGTPRTPTILRGEDGRVEWESEAVWESAEVEPGPLVLGGRLHFVTSDPNNQQNFRPRHSWAVSTADAWWQRDGASPANDYRLRSPER